VVQGDQSTAALVTQVVTKQIDCSDGQKSTMFFR